MEALIVIGWIICGILTYGIWVADSLHYFPEPRFYRKTIGLGIYFGLFGPVGLLLALLSTGFAEHGIRFK